MTRRYAERHRKSQEGGSITSGFLQEFNSKGAAGQASDDRLTLRVSRAGRLLMRVAFGEFVLDTDTRELCRDLRRLDLTPKAFELLATLIANRPRVVTKIDLQERLWPDSFVVDKNLANLVSEIRDALGEDPPTPASSARLIASAMRSDPREDRRDPRKRPARQGDARIFRLMWDDQHLTVEEGEYLIGRDPDADVYLDSPSVSRRHAMIRIAGRDATIEDLGSRNGTFVGERRIDTAIDDPPRRRHSCRFGRADLPTRGRAGVDEVSRLEVASGDQTCHRRVR